MPAPNRPGRKHRDNAPTRMGHIACYVTEFNRAIDYIPRNKARSRPPAADLGTPWVGAWRSHKHQAPKPREECAGGKKGQDPQPARMAISC